MSSLINDVVRKKIITFLLFMICVHITPLAAQTKVGEQSLYIYRVELMDKVAETGMAFEFMRVFLTEECKLYLFPEFSFPSEEEECELIENNIDVDEFSDRDYKIFPYDRGYMIDQKFVKEVQAFVVDHCYEHFFKGKKPKKIPRA